MNANDVPPYRLYSDLAYLWPLMSPPGEYAEEAAHWRRVLREALGPGRHRILELGVGGGHNLSHLAGDFDATAADISEAMLANSRRLNPGVAHLLGDMRTLRLDKKFDAVLIHDAISHMLTEHDLLAAFTTAAAHLNPGGIFVTAPDNFKETFKSPYTECCTHSNDEMDLTYCEYGYDPDPGDTTISIFFTFLIRTGKDLQIEHDRGFTGLFPKDTWRRLFETAGFEFGERRFTLKPTGAEYTLLVGKLKPPHRG